MKKGILAVAFIALFFVSIASASAIKVIVNDVSPQPVEPGNDLTIRITFSNVDNDFATSTAALDSKSAANVFQSIRDLNEKLGHTVIVITHEESLGAAADRGIWLKDGQVVKEKNF